jgi:hypothetical protein
VIRCIGMVTSSPSRFRACVDATDQRPAAGADRHRSRLCFALAALFVVPFGIATKFYGGPAASWVMDNAGSVLYVVFRILVVMAARP